jgi:hypothetical protein
VEAVVKVMRRGPIALPRVSEAVPQVVIFDYEMVGSEKVPDAAPSDRGTSETEGRTKSAEGEGPVEPSSEGPP